MRGDQLTPGEWPDLSDRELQRRLRDLARLRLGAAGQHADDVVSRAIIRWARMHPGTTSAARLEKVIASEVSSLMRSELRLKRRERRAALDRTSPTLVAQHQDWGELRLSLDQSIRRRQIPPSATDGAILEMLYEGHTITAIAATLGISRYAVTSCRERWRRIARDGAFSG
jgi:hypothetical protein